MNQRNAQCQCRSGKKYKNCCMQQENEEQSFLSKLEIVNSYENEIENTVEIDFLYDGLPYHMTVKKQDPSIDLQGMPPLPLAIWVAEDFILGKGDAVTVEHHLVYGDETGTMEGFKIVESGKKEKMLRVLEHRIGTDCPFCKDSRYHGEHENRVCKLTGTSNALLVVRELELRIFS